MNDWSARDVQREETALGLGPAKAKDFATSLGPFIVTIDEFAGTAGSMTARVNGIERSRGEIASAYYSWPQIVERAARNTTLSPGDVLGSGTVGTGCILELGTEEWLQIGDRIELSIDGLGTLANEIGPPRSAE
jgi:fumarylacetoacetate (FAA) hydrolase